MMKHGLIWVSLLTLSMALTACGGKQSAVEGKLVDGSGKPVAGVKITAAQVQPIKGYEQFEAVTSSDGSFQIRGLFPSSKYELKPWSDQWMCHDTAVTFDSAPQGETSVLPLPMVVGGVISDSRTGLEWVIGPDQDVDYAQAEQWVAGCKVAGGGWRMPTRQELATLYQEGVGEKYMDPAFKTTGNYVWAESRDSSSAWHFAFVSFQGGERRGSRDMSYLYRVFAVRSR